MTLAPNANTIMSATANVRELPMAKECGPARACRRSRSPTRRSRSTSPAVEDAKRGQPHASSSSIRGRAALLPIRPSSSRLPANSVRTDDSAMALSAPHEHARPIRGCGCRSTLTERSRPGRAALTRRPLRPRIRPMWGCRLAAASKRREDAAGRRTAASSSTSNYRRECDRRVPRRCRRAIAAVQVDRRGRQANLNVSLLPGLHHSDACAIGDGGVSDHRGWLQLLASRRRASAHIGAARRFSAVASHRR